MGTATLTARVSEEDKKQFDSFCNNVGLSTSSAVNLFVKAVVRERRIPFDIIDSPIVSMEQICQDMEISEKQIAAGKVVDAKKSMKSARKKRGL